MVSFEMGVQQNVTMRCQCITLSYHIYELARYRAVIIKATRRAYSLPEIIGSRFDAVEPILH
jgi:hypothetical protein